MFSYVAKSNNQQVAIANVTYPMSRAGAESTVESFDGNCAQIMLVAKCLALSLEARLASTRQLLHSAVNLP